MEFVFIFVEYQIQERINGLATQIDKKLYNMIKMCLSTILLF